jgi:hypothetical protein
MWEAARSWILRTLALRPIQVGVPGSRLIEIEPRRAYKFPDDPLALSGDVVGRITEPISDSEQSFARLKQWYHDCLGSHTECYPGRSLGLAMPTQITKVEDRPLPTRLINIGSADGKRNPFLWECGGSRGCYAALSYCWGTSTPIYNSDRLVQRPTARLYSRRTSQNSA